MICRCCPLRRYCVLWLPPNTSVVCQTLFEVVSRRLIDFCSAAVGRESKDVAGVVEADDVFSSLGASPSGLAGNRTLLVGQGGRCGRR